jgi:hypothetical protein
MNPGAIAQRGAHAPHLSSPKLGGNGVRRPRAGYACGSDPPIAGLTNRSQATTRATERGMRCATGSKLRQLAIRQRWHYRHIGVSP